jgi:hypothetical protein
MDAAFNAMDRQIAWEQSSQAITQSQRIAAAAWVEFRDRLYPKLLHAFEQHIVRRDGRFVPIADSKNVVGVELFSCSGRAIGSGATLTFGFTLRHTTITPEIIVDGRRTRHRPCGMEEVSEEWATSWFTYLINDFIAFAR